MADPGPFVADLRAESDDLDALVAHLPADRWPIRHLRRVGPSHTRSATCCGPIEWR